MRKKVPSEIVDLLVKNVKNENKVIMYFVFLL